MDDKELADAVVALGVGSIYSFGGKQYYYIAGVIPRRLSLNADLFVHDPRVAMALMERMGPHKIETNYCKYTDGSEDWLCYIEHNDTLDKLAQVRNESLPRAITEACVKALQP